MKGNKVEKAKHELAWRDARVFARLLEDWLKGNGKAPSYTTGERKIDFSSFVDGKEAEWLLGAYSKAKKKERLLFLKTVIYFMYWLGPKSSGFETLAKVFSIMAKDGARAGELYGYIVQYGDEKIDGTGMRFSSLLSMLRKESTIEKEYYEWFSEEFQVPPEGLWLDYPTFFSTKTPKELAEMRRNVNWGALSGILSSLHGIYVGSAARGRIKDYVENGGITKLAFENRKRAARVARLLFEFGLEDISQNGEKVSLGLKETIYEARKKIEPAGLPPDSRFLDFYMDYFREHGLDENHVDEVNGLLGSGNVMGAVDRMCRHMLQACKKQYLMMGEKRYSFGKEGEKMIADFKNHVGAQGDASLLTLYDMVGKGEYAPALERLKVIFQAIKEVKGDYPHMFSA